MPPPAAVAATLGGEPHQSRRNKGSHGELSAFGGLPPGNHRKIIIMVELLVYVRTRRSQLHTRPLASQQPGQESVIIPILQMRKVK